MSSDLNQLNSLKLAVIKALSSLSFSRQGKYTSIKKNSVDLPISPDVFANKFPVSYTGQESFKTVVAINDLNDVFGENWHVINFKNSTTTKRVIGLINLHYRRKKISPSIQIPIR